MHVHCCATARASARRLGRSACLIGSLLSLLAGPAALCAGKAVGKPAPEPRDRLEPAFLRALLWPDSAAERLQHVAAVVKVAATLGTPPFRNESPPTVVFEVLDALFGCKPGERLAMREWRTAGRKLRPGEVLDEEEREELSEEYKHKTVVPPAVGARFLVLLERSGTTLVALPGPDNEPLALPDPAPEAVERVRRMAALLLSLDPPSADAVELEAVAGAPLPVRVRLTNGLPGLGRFDLALLRLSGTGPGGKALGPASPRHPPAPLTLAGNQSAPVEFDLAGLFPGLLQTPGHYFLDLEVPASAPAGLRLPVRLVVTAPAR